MFFSTVYSCGLRLQEALNLQVSDIDSGRMMVYVHRGKGAKDRYVPLPKETLNLLRRYWKTHRNAKLIFPALGRGHTGGPTATFPMNRSSVQGALSAVWLRKRELPRNSPSIPYDTPTQPTCSNRASTSESFSATWDIRAWRQPCAIFT